MHSERRNYQRLRLARPILATISDRPALILDVGMSGALIEHHGTVEPGDRVRLSFRWHGDPVEFDCDVARTMVVKNQGGRDGANSVSHTGLHFLRGVGAASELLEEMMADSIGRILAAQKANAEGRDGASAGKLVLARIGEARRMRSSHYFNWRLQGDMWQCSPSTSPAQPPDGFTVGAWEDEDEVMDLCRTYEVADEEGRRLIRLVAEISTLKH